jgi:hypothetical protein
VPVAEAVMVVVVPTKAEAPEAVVMMVVAEMMAAPVDGGDVAIGGHRVGRRRGERRGLSGTPGQQPAAEDHRRRERRAAQSRRGECSHVVRSPVVEAGETGRRQQVGPSL